jgi:hypothetical protein
VQISPSPLVILLPLCPALSLKNCESYLALFLASFSERGSSTVSPELKKIFFLQGQKKKGSLRVTSPTKPEYLTPAMCVDFTTLSDVMLFYVF